MGGVDASIESYPYQVSITRKIDYSVLFCGGTIISPYFVLTAAHCLDSDKPWFYKVRSGSTFRRRGGTIHNVTQVIKHKYFKVLDDNIRAENDIGIVRLTEPFIYDSTCQAIGLFEVYQLIPISATGVVTGWGKKISGLFSAKLQVLTLPILDTNICHKVYYNYGGIRGGQICAGDLNNGLKNICHGDSGGPLVVKGRLAGIASWVGEPCGSSNTPAVFTDITKYRPWIKYFTNI